MHRGPRCSKAMACGSSRWRASTTTAWSQPPATANSGGCGSPRCPSPSRHTPTSRPRWPGQEAGHMLPWAVRDPSSRRDRRQHALPRHRRRHRPRRDRLHLVCAPLPADPRQHGLQAAAARPCVRRARLRGGRFPHRQLQLRLAAGDRRARREEGRRHPPPPAAPRRHRARHRDVQHPGQRVAAT